MPKNLSGHKAWFAAYDQIVDGGGTAYVEREDQAGASAVVAVDRARNRITLDDNTVARVMTSPTIPALHLSRYPGGGVVSYGFPSSPTVGVFVPGPPGLDPVDGLPDPEAIPESGSGSAAILGALVGYAVGGPAGAAVGYVVVGYV
jgi:hypothetical protein